MIFVVLVLMVHTEKIKINAKFCLSLGLFCSLCSFTLNLSVLICVHGLAEFSRFTVSCVYKIKVLSLYNEI